MSGLYAAWASAQAGLPTGDQSMLCKSADGSWETITKRDLMQMIAEGAAGDTIELQDVVITIGSDGETVHLAPAGQSGMVGRAPDGGRPFEKSASRSYEPSFGDGLLAQYHANNMRNEI